MSCQNLGIYGVWKGIALQNVNYRLQERSARNTQCGYVP